MTIDPLSRTCVGFAVYSQSPSSDQIQRFLDRAIRSSRSTPKYVVTDKGKQFWCASFKHWCKRRGVRPRYGRVGEPASIAIVERFIRSMKQECTRCLLVPMSLAAMRREITLYTIWYNTQPCSNGQVHRHRNLVPQHMSLRLIEAALRPLSSRTSATNLREIAALKSVAHFTGRCFREAQGRCPDTGNVQTR